MSVATWTTCQTCGHQYDGGESTTVRSCPRCDAVYSNGDVSQIESDNKPIDLPTLKTVVTDEKEWTIEVDYGKLRTNKKFRRAFKDEMGKPMLDYFAENERTLDEMIDGIEFIAWWIDGAKPEMREWFAENFVTENAFPFFALIEKRFQVKS